MTNATVSAITDTPRTCPAYAWCELDHADPEILRWAPQSHEKHVTLTAGDITQSFLLSVVGGTPRIECSLDVDELWREPGEATDSFNNLSEVFAAASALYADFARDASRSLKRDLSVTHELASRDV